MTKNASTALDAAGYGSRTGHSKSSKNFTTAALHRLSVVGPVYFSGREESDTSLAGRLVLKSILFSLVVIPARTRRRPVGWPP